MAVGAQALAPDAREELRARAVIEPHVLAREALPTPLARIDLELHGPAVLPGLTSLLRGRALGGGPLHLQPCLAVEYLLLDLGERRGRDELVEHDPPDAVVLAGEPALEERASVGREGRLERGRARGRVRRRCCVEREEPA